MMAHSIGIQLCHLCGSPLEAGGVYPSRYGICPGCADSLRARVSPEAVGTLPGGAVVTAAMLYEGPAIELIEAIKIRGHRRPLRFIAECIIADLLPGDAAPLMPIPASRRGRRVRGFDQMALLARFSGAEVEHVFTHRGGTQQKSLDRAARDVHARSALRLRGAPRRRGVLLDDVYTTGASINAAAEMIGEAGYPPLGALVVCAVP